MLFQDKNLFIHGELGKISRQNSLWFLVVHVRENSPSFPHNFLRKEHFRIISPHLPSSGEVAILGAHWAVLLVVGTAGPYSRALCFRVLWASRVRVQRRPALPPLWAQALRALPIPFYLQDKLFSLSLSSLAHLAGMKWLQFRQEWPQFSLRSRHILKTIFYLKVLYWLNYLKNWFPYFSTICSITQNWAENKNL